MERSRSDIEKTCLQAYTDSAIVTMEETLQGWGKAEKDSP
jgi:hypothetical protein